MRTLTMTGNSNNWVVMTTRALLLASLLVCAPVFADNSTFGKQDAAKQAQKENGGGRVLGVKQTEKNGSVTFEVKLITDGKVRVLSIKAP